MSINHGFAFPLDCTSITCLVSEVSCEYHTVCFDACNNKLSLLAATTTATDTSSIIATTAAAANTSTTTSTTTTTTYNTTTITGIGRQTRTVSTNRHYQSKTIQAMPLV